MIGYNFAARNQFGNLINARQAGGSSHNNSILTTTDKDRDDPASSEIDQDDMLAEDTAVEKLFI